MQVSDINGMSPPVALSELQFSLKYIKLIFFYKKETLWLEHFIGVLPNNNVVFDAFF